MGADVRLAMRGLSVGFAMNHGTVRAVHEVDLDVRKGEVVALVGESGSGKSTLMLAVMGLLAPNAHVTGSAILGGDELIGASPSVLRGVRGARLSMVFQDPMTSLNPVLSVGRQLMEAVRVHSDVTKVEARKRAVELLDAVAIPRAADRLEMFPHEFSGGMRQRVMIAMAIAHEPEVLIADEPTTALDVTIQAQILDVLDRLRRERQLAIVLVTHDLGIVAGLADHVCVMYAGAVIERGDVRSVFYESNHPYTTGLLACSPRIDGRGELVPIPGAPPAPSESGAGCAFAPRCSLADDRCRAEAPRLVLAGTTHAACHHVPSKEVRR